MPTSSTSTPRVVSIGRKITYKYVDDAYNPAQSVPVTRQLVEQDKVFAVYNSLGTAHNIAVRPYLNALKVPQLFVASGATTFGRDYAQYPYTIGFQPSYQAEGWVYGKYLARTAPGATVAVLFQNDDYGKDLLGGLEGAATVEGEGHRGTALRGHRARRLLADREAEVVRCRHARDLRDPDVRDPGLPVREQARLEAEADHQQRRRIRLDLDADAPPRAAEQARQRHRLDRVPQGPDRPQVEERCGDQALPQDHGAVRARGERRRSAARVRDGVGLDCRRCAEEGGQEPDARIGDQGARHLQRER